jgi:hypothetical protein
MQTNITVHCDNEKYLRTELIHNENDLGVYETLLIGSTSFFMTLEQIEELGNKISEYVADLRKKEAA